MYAYDETEGQKSSNNLCSMLFHCCREVSYLPLVLICDNYKGQKKRLSGYCT